MSDFTDNGEEMTSHSRKLPFFYSLRAVPIVETADNVVIDFTLVRSPGRIGGRRYIYQPAFFIHNGSQQPLSNLEIKIEHSNERAFPLPVLYTVSAKTAILPGHQAQIAGDASYHQETVNFVPAYSTTVWRLTQPGSLPIIRSGFVRVKSITCEKDGKKAPLQIKQHLLVDGRTETPVITQNIFRKVRRFLGINGNTQG